MPSIQTIRNDLDNALQAKQSLMSVQTYNKYWRLVAENWDDKEELGKLYTKINKIKQSKVAKLKQELKALRDAGEINPNVKLNQSEEKLKDIYNNHYLSKFDNDEIIVQLTKKMKPVLLHNGRLCKTCITLRIWYVKLSIHNTENGKKLDNLLLLCNANAVL